MPLFRKKRDEPVDPNERSPQLGLKYKDLAMLEQLMKAGADLDEPRHVRHFLYFSTQAAAVAAASMARDAGFAAEVSEPLPDHADWGLLCEQHGVVTDPYAVRDTGNLFDEIAKANGGEYDGWEASV